MFNLKRYNILIGREISLEGLYYREGWQTSQTDEGSELPSLGTLRSASQQASL
jgi:hypothetical protein